MKYIVRLIKANGSTADTERTWTDWWEAAKWAESEVSAKRAVGFRILEVGE